MKRLPLATVAPLLLFMGCASSMPISSSQLLDASSVGKFLPIDPQRSDQVSYFDSSGKEVATTWSALPKEQILDLLSNQDAVITTSKVESSGSVKYLTSGITAEAGTYRVTFDYMNYRPIDLTDPATKAPVGQGRVGVGLRIKAEIETRKADIDLGSLIALGLAAKQGNVRGTLNVVALGLSSQDIRTLFPTPSQIDETSIQKALEALAAIKAKIGDTATHLDPQLIAWRPSGTGAATTPLTKRLQ
jgi:hypothetical protein